MAANSAISKESLSAVTNEYTVTPEKISELVDRIVVKADPIAVIAFGSRARGDHRPDSDLDLAVIVEGREADHPQLPLNVREGIRMSVDLLTIPKEKYERFRPGSTQFIGRLTGKEFVFMNAGENPQIEVLLSASARDQNTLQFPIDDEVFGFHAQQAVEKLYKALICALGEEFRFTHDLKELANQLQQLGEPCRSCRSATTNSMSMPSRRDTRPDHRSR